MSEKEIVIGEPVGISQVTRVWSQRTPFCRSSMYALCSAPEEEWTVSCSCFAKKVEEDITILKTAIHLGIILFPIQQICNTISNTIPKR